VSARKGVQEPITSNDVAMNDDVTGASLVADSGGGDFDV